jgi:hypothetical protein
VEKSDVNENKITKLAKRKNVAPILTSITKKTLIKHKDGVVTKKAKEVDKHKRSILLKLATMLNCVKSIKANNSLVNILSSL